MKIPLSEKTIVAVDPGEVTGIVYWEKGQVFAYTMVWESLKSMCKEDFQDKHFFGFKEDQIDAIIIESFRIYPHKANALTQDPLIPARIIGMLDFVAYYHNIPVVFQSASECKGFWGDERLREEGYWRANKHERDALRHTLYYLMKDAQKENGTIKSKAG